MPHMCACTSLIPVVPARGGAEVALGIYYMIKPVTFKISYRTCRRRASPLCASVLHCCSPRTWPACDHVAMQRRAKTFFTVFTSCASQATLHLSSSPTAATSFTQQTFTHRSFLYTESFAHTQLLRRRVFTHSKLWHREAFTQGIFCTQGLLHREAFTQKGLYTQQAFAERSFYTQKFLHRTIFTHPTIATPKSDLDVKAEKSTNMKAFE